jgi:hypothetical protein
MRGLDANARGEMPLARFAGPGAPAMTAREAHYAKSTLAYRAMRCVSRDAATYQFHIASLTRNGGSLLLCGLRSTCQNLTSPRVNACCAWPLLATARCDSHVMTCVEGICCECTLTKSCVRSAGSIALDLPCVASNMSMLAMSIDTKVKH